MAGDIRSTLIQVLADDSNPLPEPTLTNHQWVIVASNWGQFDGKTSTYWGRDRVDAGSQTTFSSTVPWRKMSTIKISLKCLLKGLINNIPELVQIMAWCRPGDKPLSEPMIVSSPTHICVVYASLDLSELRYLYRYDFKTTNSNELIELRLFKPIVVKWHNMASVVNNSLGNCLLPEAPFTNVD